MKLSSTNHNPKIVARYFLECVEQAQGLLYFFLLIYNLILQYILGCPRVVRGDCGTENCIVAKVQIAFRMHHTDDLAGIRSFFYGPSTANIVSIEFN